MHVRPVAWRTGPVREGDVMTNFFDLRLSYVAALEHSCLGHRIVMDGDAVMSHGSQRHTVCDMTFKSSSTPLETAVSTPDI